MSARDVLVQEAARVRENAYVPYSNFKVGAALRAGSGAMYSGCNVENVAYPQGICAEARAIAAMVAGSDTEIKEVAVNDDSPEPVTPCGGCRQKLVEFAAADVKITMATTGGKQVTLTMADILPGAFNTQHMSNT